MHAVTGLQVRRHPAHGKRGSILTATGCISRKEQHLVVRFDCCLIVQRRKVFLCPVRHGAGDVCHPGPQDAPFQAVDVRSSTAQGGAPPLREQQSLSEKLSLRRWKLIVLHRCGTVRNIKHVHEMNERQKKEGHYETHNTERGVTRLPSKTINGLGKKQVEASWQFGQRGTRERAQANGLKTAAQKRYRTSWNIAANQGLCE